MFSYFSLNKLEW